MEDDELVGSTVVEPFIKACSFPNGIEMESDGIAAGNDCAGDDVVSIEKRTGNWFADPVAGSNKQSCFSG